MSGPKPRPGFDGQARTALIGGILLILISFITSYGDVNLLQFTHLALHEQAGVSLHLAALAALVGEIELASRLRNRARNRALEDREQAVRDREQAVRDREQAARDREQAAREAARQRDRAVEREQRQNRALRAGALFLLNPSPLHQRFLAYVASELAGPPINEKESEAGGAFPLD